ncbi:hypothetical protein J0910_07005 [Nocardiopsis sp. CNT-189]|uniref:hypothetical protein n=1 Tax=Nocardiopsis oceanisediminis TaxID=2816862 RepID=UPI003B373193
MAGPDAPLREPQGMTRAEAAGLVRRVMAADYASEEECDRILDRLDRALGCPGGRVAGLVFWPDTPDPAPERVVERALAYCPFAL